MKKLLVTLFICQQSLSFAQTPDFDPAWILKSAGSDEFNSPSLTALWGDNASGTAMSQYHMGQKWEPNNVILDVNYPTGNNGKGALRLKFTGANTNVIPVPPTESNNPGAWWVRHNDNFSDWRSAGIYSALNFPFLYGFYETRAKMPGYPSAANPLVKTQLGLIPVIWMSKECECNDNPAKASVACPKLNAYYVEEIDQLEGDGWSNRNFEINSHWFWSSDECPLQLRWRSKDQTITPETDLVNNFHKYGMEVNPKYIDFYFDDVVYARASDPSQIPTHALTVWLGLPVANPLTTPVQIPTGFIEPSAPLVQNPALSTMEFIIDYFRYYEYNTANCQADYVILNNLGLQTMPNELRRDVSIGLAGSIAPANMGVQVVSLGSSDSYNIKHSWNFSILCDFTVPLGAQLSVKPTACP